MAEQGAKMVVVISGVMLLLLMTVSACPIRILCRLKIGRATLARSIAEPEKRS